MRLCMFSPAGQELERGWPGRIDGEHVTQLAAQTLQSFFASGSSAREHAAFRLDDVVLRAPVLEPPAVRIFDDPASFCFANPAAVRSPGARIPRPSGRLDAVARRVAVIGCDGEIAGWTGLVQWLAPALAHPKDCDFCLLLGPVVETEGGEDGFEWEAARALAEAHTRLRPGDLLAGSALAHHEDVGPGPFGHAFDGLGELRALVG